MAGISRGLGKGLGALLGEMNEINNSSTVNEIKSISLELIRINPNQPRKNFQDDSLRDLADSIRSQGVLQPIIVRTTEISNEVTYEIIAGERRFRAAKLAGLTEIPVIIRNMDDNESLAVALVENIQREDLNPIDQANAFNRLMLDWNLSQEELSKQIGKSRSAIANSLRLLKLSETQQELICVGALSAGHARALLSVSSEEDREELKNRIIEQALNVRQAEDAAVYWKEKGSLPPIKKEEENQIENSIKNMKKRKKELPEQVVQIRNYLEEHFNMKVRIKFEGSSGCISFYYQDENHLKEFFNKIGLEGVNFANV